MARLPPPRIALPGAPTLPGQQQTLADLYYNQYRDYDPTTGRYIQADPISLAGDANPYSYAGSNPVGMVDPEGLTRLSYDVGTNTLHVDPQSVTGRRPYAIRATSGVPGCGCTERDRNRGPIPRGNYVIYAREITGYPPVNIARLVDWRPILQGRRPRLTDWGSWRVPLHPARGTETFGRDGFFLHGGMVEGSAGCIDFGGGFSGNVLTVLLRSDIFFDRDGRVQLYVYDSRRRR